MAPQTFAEWVAFGSLALAALSLAGSWLGRRGAAAQADQAIRDKLDSIDGTGKDTRADVREINRKLDEDRQQIASISTRVDGMEQRLARVEGRCDRCRIGGTE